VHITPQSDDPVLSLACKGDGFEPLLGRWSVLLLDPTASVQHQCDIDKVLQGAQATTSQRTAEEEAITPNRRLKKGCSREEQGAITSPIQKLKMLRNGGEHSKSRCCCEFALFVVDSLQ
jgi:hypothetical protein